MREIRFLEYLSTEGVSANDARAALNLIDDYISELKAKTEVGSLVEETRLSWQNAGDGTLLPVTEIVTQKMSAESLVHLRENLDKLSEAEALQEWLNAALEYYDAVTEKITISLTSVDLESVYSLQLAMLSHKINKYMSDILFNILPDPEGIKTQLERAKTEEEYFKALSAAELSRYYTAQAAAATIGDYVHPNGKFARARLAMLDNISHPCEISLTLKGAVVTRRVPTVTIDEVNKVYFDLQNLQRDYQKHVNSVKFKLEDAENKGKQDYYARANELYRQETELARRYEKIVGSIIDEINEAAKAMKITVPKGAAETLEAIITRKKQ